jgi:hypothetical protein
VTASSFDSNRVIHETYDAFQVVLGDRRRSIGDLVLENVLEVVDGEQRFVNPSVQDPPGSHLVASRIANGFERLDCLRPRHIVKIPKQLPDLIDRRIDHRAVDTLSHGCTSLE